MTDQDFDPDEELRISSEDGMAYSKLEFIEYFGDEVEWNTSEVAHVILSNDASEEEHNAAIAAAEALEIKATAKDAELAVKKSAKQAENERKERADEVKRVAEVIAKKEAEKMKRIQQQEEEAAAKKKAKQAKEQDDAALLVSKRKEEEEAAEKKAKQAKEQDDAALLVSKRKEEEKMKRMQQEEEEAAKKKAKQDQEEKKANEKQEQLEKEEAERVQKRKNTALAEEIEEAANAQKVIQEQLRKKKAAEFAEIRKLDAALNAAKEKLEADEKVKKEEERAKRKQKEAKSAAKSAERAMKKAEAAKISQRGAMVKERDAALHAGLEVEDHEVFQAKLKEMEEKDRKEKEDRINKKEEKRKRKEKEKKQQETPEMDENTALRSSALTSNSMRSPTLTSTRPVPAFLSPRNNPLHQKPQLPEYGKEYEMLQEKESEFEIEAGLTLRDIARQMESQREIEIESQNLRLQYQIRNCPPHYNHQKFEESYKDLMKHQKDFKATLKWDKDPEKKTCPVSPRITSFYNPSVKDSRKVPSKPSFGHEKNTIKTPNSAHRKLKRGEAYKTKRKKKVKKLSAKAMLESFIKSRASIPPQLITDRTPVRDNNNVSIVLEPRSRKKEGVERLAERVKKKELK